MKERVYCVTVALNHDCVTALFSEASKFLLFMLTPCLKRCFSLLDWFSKTVKGKRMQTAIEIKNDMFRKMKLIPKEEFAEFGK